MISTIRLVNTSITSHNYLLCVCVCVCVVRTFRIYSNSNFQVYNTVLLTTVFVDFTLTFPPPPQKKQGMGMGRVLAAPEFPYIEVTEESEMGLKASFI